MRTPPQRVCLLPSCVTPRDGLLLLLLLLLLSRLTYVWLPFQVLTYVWLPFQVLNTKHTHLHTRRVLEHKVCCISVNLLLLR
jgi:hypothetical protein